MGHRRPTRLKITSRMLGTTAYPRCTSGKAGYRDRAAALDQAEALMAQGTVQPRCHLTPYRCDRCGEWHLYNRRVI